MLRLNTHFSTDASLHPITDSIPGQASAEKIMSNLTQREWIRMQRDAEMDWRTEIRAAERNAHIKVAKGLKDEGIDPTIIAKVTGLSLGEITEL